MRTVFVASDPTMRRLSLLAAALVLSAAQAQPRTDVVVQGLDRPWAFAFLPEGQLLVAEKPGALRLVAQDGRLSAPLAGVPAVAFGGQGGLHDVVPDSAFARNRTLYLCYAEPGSGEDAGKSGTALARAQLKADGSGLEGLQVIFRQAPKMDSRHHFGCRIVEARDGALFLVLGDRGRGMALAQQLDSHIGKVVRLGKDGKVPADNPFASTAGARAEIWSYGHRNAQGATLDAQGRLWLTEHGPQGGDELNLVQRGRNYGWPVITYGENYGGGPIGEGLSAKDGMEQPVQQWTPSIAPSGLAFVPRAEGGGDFFVGALKFRQLQRVRVEAQDRVVGRPEVVAEGVGRVRDVRRGPDGAIYLLAEDEGRILRLSPRP